MIEKLIISSILLTPPAHGMIKVEMSNAQLSKLISEKKRNDYIPPQAAENTGSPLATIYKFIKQISASNYAYQGTQLQMRREIEFRDIIRGHNTTALPAVTSNEDTKALISASASVDPFEKTESTNSNDASHTSKAPSDNHADNSGSRSHYFIKQESNLPQERMASTAAASKKNTEAGISASIDPARKRVM